MTDLLSGDKRAWFCVRELQLDLRYEDLNDTQRGLAQLKAHLPANVVSRMFQAARAEIMQLSLPGHIDLASIVIQGIEPNELTGRMQIRYYAKVDGGKNTFDCGTVHLLRDIGPSIRRFASELLLKPNAAA